jgi:hypothetical protein
MKRMDDIYKQKESLVKFEELYGLVCRKVLIFNKKLAFCSIKVYNISSLITTNLKYGNYK